MHMKKRLVILVLVLCLFLSLAVPAAAAGPVRGKVVAMTFDDGPNTNITPVLLDELAATHPEVKVGKINVDEQGSLAMKYRIMSIPTLILFKEGEPAATSVGFRPLKELEALIG